ncbi:MAG: hypothetical protein ACRC26_01990, partial [Bacteroidales bacterium]
NDKKILDSLCIDKELASPILSFDIEKDELSKLDINISGFHFDESSLNAASKETIRKLNAAYAGELGNYINKELVPGIGVGESKNIGSICGFSLYIQNTPSEAEGMFTDSVIKAYCTGMSDIRYTHNNGKYPVSDQAAGMYFLNAIVKIPGLVSNQTIKVRSLEKTLTEAASIKTQEWDRLDELKLLKEESSILKKRIEDSINKEKNIPSDDDQEIVTKTLRPKL